MSAPKVRPILFSAPMVRALLAGTKTQTRRIVKPAPNAVVDRHAFASGAFWDTLPVKEPDGRVSGDRHVLRGCPYGAPGEKLWVRESVRWDDEEDRARFLADGALSVIDNWPWKSRTLPGIFLPRGASRISLEVTDVRVERLQDISEDDACAEGVPRDVPGAVRGARTAYASLWDQINGDRAPWASNPWVWVLSFSVSPTGSGGAK